MENKKTNIKTTAFLFPFPKLNFTLSLKTRVIPPQEMRWGMGERGCVYNGYITISLCHSFLPKLFFCSRWALYWWQFLWNYLSAPAQALCGPQGNLCSSAMEHCLLRLVLSHWSSLCSFSLFLFPSSLLVVLYALS